MALRKSRMVGPIPFPSGRNNPARAAHASSAGATRMIRNRSALPRSAGGKKGQREGPGPARDSPEPSTNYLFSGRAVALLGTESRRRHGAIRSACSWIPKNGLKSAVPRQVSMRPKFNASSLLPRQRLSTYTEASLWPTSNVPSPLRLVEQLLMHRIKIDRGPHACRFGPLHKDADVYGRTAGVSIVMPAARSARKSSRAMNSREP